MKPSICEIPKEIALPFIERYCNERKLDFSFIDEEECSKGVLWMGALYGNMVHAVLGLFVYDARPNELYIYGLYGDGTARQYRPLRALIEFIVNLPYDYKYGYVISDNGEMLHTVKKFGWVLDESDLPSSRQIVKVSNKWVAEKVEAEETTPV